MRRKKKFFLILAAVILLFFLNFTGAGDKIKARALILISPVTTRMLSFSGNFSNFRERFFNSNRKDNKILNERVQFLEQELTKLTIENQDLKKALKNETFVQKVNFEAVPARVVARADTSSLIFILDKGRKDGIKNGQIVISGYGILIGRIIKVEEEHAFLRFLTDEESKFTASIADEDGVVGEAKGRLGSTLELELVPREIELSPNDKLVTAGLEEGVPQGLVIGKVLQVFADPQSPLQRALIQPEASVADLRLVSVIQIPSP